MAISQGTATSRSRTDTTIVPATGWLSRLSQRSWIILGAGVTASLAAFVTQIMLLRAGAAFAAVAASDLGEALVVGWAALTIVLLALRLPHDDVLRDQWLMLGASVGAFFAGDMIWAWYEVALRVKPPYPGPADFFYAASYLLFAVAVLYAAVTYAHGVNLRVPTWLAIAAGLLMTAAAFPLAVTPITGSGAPLGEQAISIAYIFGDVWLQIVPALFIVLVIQRTGHRRAAWAWMAVALAAGVMGVSDAVFGVVAAQGLYQPGSLADLGWMIGHVLIAVGASMAVDAHAGDELLDEARA